MLRMMWREWSALPGPLRVGGLVFAIGSALDLAYHLAPGAWAVLLDRYLGPDGDWAHLIIMAGMLLIVLGLLAQGLMQPARRQAGSGGKEAQKEL